MSARPTGTVTFVFTDVEGSTELLRRVGKEAHAAPLASTSRTRCAASHRLDDPDLAEAHAAGCAMTQADAAAFALAAVAETAPL